MISWVYYGLTTVSIIQIIGWECRPKYWNSCHGDGYCKACNFRYIRDFEKFAKITCFTVVLIGLYGRQRAYYVLKEQTLYTVQVG